MGKISRRDFLKLTGLGAFVSAARLGTGYIPFAANRTSETFAMLGADASLATTCGVCPRGCGLIVYTSGGRIQRIEGNPEHPLNRGVVCPRGQAALLGLIGTGRVQTPLRKDGAGRGFQPMGWQAAVAVIARALQHYEPGEIVFLMGLFPDHLHDLVGLLAQALGGAQVLRYGAPGDHTGYVTLMDVGQKLFGAAKVPYFDIERAEVIFSFGADFSELWIPPGIGPNSVEAQHRPYLAQFDHLKSQTAINADEWLPIQPGSVTLLAQALALLGSENGSAGAARVSHSRERLAQVAEACGLSLNQLEHLARLFFQSPRRVAIPGRQILAQPNGLAAAESILTLNALAGNSGQLGGLYLIPDLPVHAGLSRRPSAMAEIQALIERMLSGSVKVLFVHGANPLRDLPEAYDLRAALQNVDLLVSFSPYLDETAAEADYIFPDHSPLESWGYQVIVTGSDRPGISVLQPVTPRLYQTCATADVLLAAVRANGGGLAAQIAYRDELDFVEQSVAALADQGGVYQAADLAEFWALWQAHGGWWKQQPTLMPTVSIRSVEAPFNLEAGELVGGEAGDMLQLQLCDVGSAVPHSLRDTPDATAEVSAVLRAEINPETAHQAGIGSGDLIRVISQAGEVRASVYVVAGMAPGVIAMPLLRGHSARSDRIGEQRANLLNMLGDQQNESGELVLGGVRVRIEPVL